MVPLNTIYMMMIIYGTQVMRGVSEEKTSRIAEVIVSSVKPFQLMTGKIIGIGAVGLTQFAIWIVLIMGMNLLMPLIFPDSSIIVFSTQASVRQCATRRRPIFFRNRGMGAPARFKTRLQNGDSAGASRGSRQQRRRAGWRLALGEVALYLAVLGCSHLPYRLLLFPTPAPLPAGTATRRILPWAGGELEIWAATSQLTRQRVGGRPDVYVLRFYRNADQPERWVAGEAEEWGGRAVEI